MGSQAKARPAEGKAQIVAGGAVAMSIGLALWLLPLAARHDRHFHTALGLRGDVLVRQSPGLFLVAGLVAALPSLVAASTIPRSRIALGVSAAICLALGILCELVVSIAPEPWFVF